MNRAAHGNNWRATQLLQNDFRKNSKALVHLWGLPQFSFAADLCCSEASYCIYVFVIWDEQGKPNETVQRKVEQMMHLFLSITKQSSLSAKCKGVKKASAKRIAKSPNQLYVTHIFFLI